MLHENQPKDLQITQRPDGSQTMIFDPNRFGVEGLQRIIQYRREGYNSGILYIQRHGEFIELPYSRDASLADQSINLRMTNQVVLYRSPTIKRVTLAGPLSYNEARKILSTQRKYPNRTITFVDIHGDATVYPLGLLHGNEPQIKELKANVRRRMTNKQTGKIIIEDNNSYTEVEHH